MKQLYSEDLACIYRMNNGVLEYTPIYSSNGTFDTDEFAPVEPELVGEENVTFKGVDTTLYKVFETVERELA